MEVALSPFDIAGDAPLALGTFESRAMGEVQPQVKELLEPQMEIPKVPFGMKLLATIAAVKGSPEIAMQLMHMERKGKAYNAYLPHRETVNRLIREGKESKAYDLLNRAGGQLLTIAPELAPLMQEDLRRIDSKSAAKAELNRLAQNAELDIEEGKVDPVSVPLVKAWAKRLRLNAPTVRNEEEIKRLLESINLAASPLPSQNALAMTSKTGGVTQVQMQEAFHEQQLHGVAGQLLAQQTGLTTSDITNILNNHPLQTAAGVNITPILRPILQQKLTALQGLEANIELRKGVAKQPEVETARQQEYAATIKNPAIVNLLMASGGVLTPEQRAALGFPAATAGTPLAATNETEAARKIVAEERERLAEVPYKVQERLPIGQTELGKSYTVVGRNPTERPDEWGVDLPTVSLQAALSNPKDYVVIDKNVLAKTVIPFTRALRDLDEAVTILESVGNPDNPISRAVAGASQWLAQYIGVDDPHIPAGQAARLVVDRAIETIAGTEKIDSPEVGRLKRYVLGRFTGTTASTSAVRQLQARIVDELDATLKVSNKKAVDVLQKVREREVKKPVKPAPSTPSTPSTPLSRSTSAIMGLIDGTDDLDTPAEQSRGWTDAQQSIAVEGSVTTRQIAQVLATERANQLKKQGLKNYEDYLILDSDDKPTVLRKLNEAATLLQSAKPKYPKAPGAMKHGQ